MRAPVEMSLPVAVLELSGAFTFSFFTRYCQQCPSAVVAVLYLCVCSLHWQSLLNFLSRVRTASRRTASTDQVNMDYSVIKAENTKFPSGSYFIPFNSAVFLASLLALNWRIHHNFTPGLAVASMHNPMSARFHHTCYPFFSSNASQLPLPPWTREKGRLHPFLCSPLSHGGHWSVALEAVRR